ncbi:MFS transporter [Caldalkalibacillus mannanilyticus]|uniref:MFS transporter n=1 Tax=Caldalkalibacillus mannanilyticus TaxID=1418 RepID=UPI0004692804|nr:MFS transporter [Caldalkalibacillus mannanilyticus]
MIRTKISAYFFCVFFGLGALYPLLGIYLEEIQLTGSQMGILMSVGPIVAIFSQPFWGMLSDRYQNPKLFLILTTFFAGVVVLGFLMVKQYFLLIFVMALLSWFQSAITPLSDSITIGYVKKNGGEYGALRSWGAIGFAVAVWVAGMVIEVTFIEIIFYLFAFSFLISTCFAFQMPKEAETLQVDLKAGMSKLFRIPEFNLLMMSSFLILGSIFANNFYFGIYYTSEAIGGTVAGVGLVFLFAAGSEAPFMKLTGFFVRRFGLHQILIIASIFSAARWLFFYTEPSTTWIFLVSILQGISIGLYIPAAVELVRALSPEEVKVTGMSVYSTVANGIGSMFCTYVGGVIFEYYSIAHTYLFFGLATLLGTVILVRLLFVHRLKKVP